MVTRSVSRSDIENYAYFTPLDGKRALVKGWDKGKEAKPRDQIRGNAGLLLEHAGLSDIDLDSPEIKAMLPRFVPTSTLTLGRGGVPSHYLYSGALPNDEGMKDLDGNRMVEVRHRGKQVMWAGSVHPDTGQEIEVLNEGPLLPVPDQEDILKAYTAAMIAKYLPTGDRHSLAMAYAGYLLRQGLEEGRTFAQSLKQRGTTTPPLERHSTTSYLSWRTPNVRWRTTSPRPAATPLPERSLAWSKRSARRGAGTGCSHLKRRTR
jgi:hypothetical protein